MDALGCTAAPGNLFAQVCLTTLNPPRSLGGAELDKSILEYIGPSTNVCNQTAQWRYLPRNSTTWQTKTITGSGCGFAAYQTHWDPNPNIWLQHSYQFCGRVKNTATGGIYTAWVCHTISA